MDRKTYLAKNTDIKRTWHLIDASGKVLGRLATEAADKLRGKGKPIYTPSVDCGDFVVVTNASKVVLTGKKLEQKFAFHFLGHPGSDRHTPYSVIMEKNPEKAVILAVKGMLPKNKLASRQIKRLKIYKNSSHPHAAQFASSVSGAK
ncbi:MAG: 50S ribosomal protein L13 [Elusimicrobia bacterium]|nr:50S ribosomal protein L13 [Elusimicrobiota bacterium]